MLQLCDLRELVPKKATQGRQFKVNETHVQAPQVLEFTAGYAADSNHGMAQQTCRMISG